MAVLRFEVTKITKEFDGETCEVESKLISVHKDLFGGVYQQISKRPLNLGEEFQEWSDRICRK